MDSRLQTRELATCIIKSVQTNFVTEQLNAFSSHEQNFVSVCGQYCGLRFHTPDNGVSVKDINSCSIYKPTIPSAFEHPKGMIIPW
jgi:hypothetical protein